MGRRESRSYLTPNPSLVLFHPFFIIARGSQQLMLLGNSREEVAPILFLCEKFPCHNSLDGTQCSELLPAQ